MKRIMLFMLSAIIVLSVCAFPGSSDDGGSILCGDVDHDGKIGLSDASMVLKHIAEWDVGLDVSVADTKPDGAITLADVSFLLKYIAGWNVVLGDPIGTDIGYDFGGEEFKFLYYGNKAEDYYDEYIWDDNYNGGVICDAVSERNSTVERDLNVVITAEECESPIMEATSRMQAGQCDFDVIYDWGIRQKSAALDGFLYDFNILDKDYYIDLDESYWLPEATEELCVADRLFVTSNAVSMNYFAHAEIIYFNKNITDTLGFAYPYESVKDGTWTYDKLLEMAIAAEKDVNRDGLLDNRDRLGGISGDSFLSGVCAAPIMEKGADGTYAFIPYTEKMVNMYNKYYSASRNLVSLSAEDIVAGKDISVFPSLLVAARHFSFGDGHTLFMEGTVDMSKEFVDMRDDYGVVPVPVVNEGDEYTTVTDYRAPMFSIPYQVKDPEKTGVTFEYMADLSEMYLLPAYMETTIHTKRMYDTRDYEMLEIVLSSVKYHWSGVYLWDGECASIRDKMLYTGDFATFKRYGAKCQSEIDEVLERILALED